MAEKWREVPGGTDQQPRRFSDELLQASTADLSAWWERQFEAARSFRGWYWELYGEILRDKRVLEIGSGLGFDAVQLASRGAAITCCDIAPSNLEIVRRIAEVRGLNIQTLHIDGLAALERGPPVDAVWAIGSIHHMPFAEAREESAAALERLKPGGRWIELCYPRERWVREGSPPFREWGRLTDGERTPWVEWYDIEKLKERLHPWRIEPIMERRFESDTYVWMDCRMLGRGDDRAITRRRAEEPAVPLYAAGPIWSYAWQMPLGRSPAGAAVTVELECVVERGSVGFVLLHPTENRFISREAIVEARTGNQRIYLTTEAYATDVRLLTRCATAIGNCEYRIKSIELRESL
ncbi:Methyltransferase domain-containing protein [Rhodospirillales bacterium URHD0017]|nr:Methyltransferase domain-containing protein [Rhodospirillales bacterium URHD0017]